jgi:hypothetical protein
MTTTTLTKMSNRMLMANHKLYGLLAEHNDPIIDADNFRPTCDDCGQLTDQDVCDDHDGQCQACYDASHFKCKECGEVYENDSKHEEFPQYCVDCGQTRHDTIVETLKEKLESAVDLLANHDDEIDRLKKLLALARKLAQ